MKKTLETHMLSLDLAEIMATKIWHFRKRRKLIKQYRSKLSRYRITHDQVMNYILSKKPK
jgi:hypothetical protein